MLLIGGVAVPTNGSTAEATQYDLDVIIASGRLGKATVRLTLVGYTGSYASASGVPRTGSFAGGVGCVVLLRSYYADYGCATLKPTSYKSDGLMDVSTLSFSPRLVFSKIKATARFTFTSTTPATTSAQPFINFDQNSLHDGFAAGTQVTRQRLGKLTGTLSAGAFWGKGSIKSGNGSLMRATLATVEAAP